MRIIFVCTGNTCRSPMAEGYLKAQNLADLEVESRGLYTDGFPASINSRIVTSELGIDISEHISTSLTKEDLSVDLIICLAQNHIDTLKSVGIDNKKLMLLGEGIPDPYGQDIEEYRKTLQEIINAIDRLIDSGTFGGFSIRTANTDDAEDIANIEKECFSEPWSENAVKDSINAGNTFFIAEYEGETVGYIGINTVLDEGYINNIAVKEKWRKSGVGRLLLSRIVRFANSKKLAFISLEVRQSNQTAISLYELFEFKKAGVRHGFYSKPHEDAVIMTRRFD